MNACCAVVLPARHAALIGLLPPTSLRAEGGGRIYLFYTTGEAFQNLAFHDLDGERLIESRVFDTLAAAKAWAAEDALTKRSTV